MMAVVAVGGCAALLGAGLLSLPRVAPGGQSQSTTLESQVSTQGSAEGQNAYTRVKVRYFQMSAALPGVTQEYFVLPSPATYSGLRNAVIAAHPALASMMSSMLVLVDGVVAKSDTPLQDGDEVDFVPTMAGG
jgi:molybdopterin converting factor small subunit